MTIIDLKDAYLSVPFHELSQKFLRFACPFGLCSAPRIFRKLLRPIAAFLRKKSIRVLIHLDDFLLLAQTKEKAIKNSQLFSSPSLPGFYNKPQKILSKSNTGNLLPGLQHLFFVHGNFTPSGKGLQNSGLLQPPGNFPNRHITTSNKSDRTTGVLTPSHLACPTPFPPFTDGSNIRSCRQTRIATTYSEFLTGTRLVVDEHSQCKWQSCSPPYSGHGDHDRCWVAVHHSIETNGKWSEQESLHHINYLESKAAFLALKSFVKDKSHLTISLQIDSTVAIAYIKNKGGTHSPQLVYLALELWESCQAKNIFMIATHIPEKDNASADKESRIFKDVSEWKLNPITIQPCPQNCDTDLFSSRLATQLKDYISGDQTQAPSKQMPFQ